MIRSLLLITACATAALCCAQFGPYTAFAPTMPYRAQEVLLDLDSDGDEDALFAAFNGTMHWLENDGGGGFSAAQTYTLGGVSNINNYIFEADLDGDADMDLVANAAVGDSARWFRNNGTAEFERMPAPGGTLLYSLSYGEAFDVELDGDLDLVLHGNGGTFLSKNLDGLGTFGPLTLITNTIAGVADMDMGDIDGDGDLDILISAQFFTFATLNTLKNLDGQGNFGSLANVGVGPDAINERCCALLDMDGDGDRDAVVNASVAPAGDLVYYPNADGQGMWGPKVNTGLGSGLMCPWALMDYDNDGDMDMAGAGLGRAQWLEQLAPGTFALHAGPSLPAYFDRTQVGDVDGDGDQDILAMASDGYCTAWAPGEGTGYGAWNILDFEPIRLPDMAAADVDGDGDQDALVCGETNGLLGWYPNSDGTGAFGEFAIISLGADSALALDAGDLDGDGDVDVIVAEGSGQLSWHENSAGNATSWVEHEFATGLMKPTLLKLADLEDDGDLDVVFCTKTDHLIQFCLNTGGTFSPPQLLADPVYAPISMDVADLNGDPWPDVVVCNSSNTTIRWYEAQPGGTSFSLASALPSTSNSTVCIRAQDVDGDGDNDLLYCHEGNGRVSYMANTGVGVFSAGLYISTGLNIKRATAAELNGDGVPDVLCLRTLNNGSVWLPGLGGGTFAPALTVPSQMYQGLDILTADVDGDLDQDILQCNNSTTAALLENHFGSPFRITGTVFLDLDADGSFSGGDEFVPYVPATTTPYVMTPYTEPDGDYLFLLDSGAYTVEAPLVGTCWVLSTDSAAYHEVLTAQQPAVSGRDFGYAITCDTTTIALSHSSVFVCSAWMSVDIHVRNIGTTHAQGSLRVLLDPLVTFMSSVPPPTQQNGDTLWYDQSAMDYFEQRNIQLSLDPPGAEALGDTLLFSMDFEASDGGHFGDELARIVTCAYDPNAKEVEPGGLGAEGIIPNTTERLNYTIHFQNTGTDTATTVRLHDQLSSLLDPGSIQVLGYTHPFDLHVEAEGEAIFTFNNIMLPDSGADLVGSQGHVVFSIALQPGLAGGSVIENSAAIVFDFNAAVITNTTVNTLFDCALFVPVFNDLGAGILQASSGVDYQWYWNGTAIDGATQSEFLADVTGSYSVEITNTEGCVVLTPEQLVVIEGLSDLDGGAVTLIPNPSTGDVRLVYAEAIGVDDRIELTDMNGHTLRCIPGKGAREIIVERRSLAAGMYSVCVLRDGVRVGHARMVLE